MDELNTYHVDVPVEPRGDYSLTVRAYDITRAVGIGLKVVDRRGLKLRARNKEAIHALVRVTEDGESSVHVPVMLLLNPPLLNLPINKGDTGSPQPPSSSKAFLALLLLSLGVGVVSIYLAWQGSGN